MQRIASTILLFLLVVSGCNSTFSTSEAEKTAFEDIKIDVFFCPEDSCEQEFVNFLETAQESIYCALYDLESEAISEALAKKSSEILVQTVIDERNYDNQITGEGVKVANPVQYMHNKFCIVDNDKVLTGSTNPTQNGLIYNNNNILILESKTIADNFKDEFDELWNGIYGRGNKIEQSKMQSDTIQLENYFCPEDSCQTHVLNHLQSAQESIYFMTFAFTDEKIADVIILKEFDVQGVVEARSKNTMGSQYQRMKDFGVDVITDKNKKTMHHKVFIIDNRTVITGSYNPTKSGNLRNDENLLIITNKDIAEEFVEEFNQIRTQALS